MSELRDKFEKEPVYHSIDGCWYWAGCPFKSGYGRFYFKGKYYRAHRVSYELNKGKIPSGLFVCHSCDNPLCINPNHLFLGTAADNTNDRISKGRFLTVGSGNPAAKLNEDNVRDIRRLVASNEMTISYAAYHFDVSDWTIKKIIYRRRWKHVA